MNTSWSRKFGVDDGTFIVEQHTLDKVVTWIADPHTTFARIMLQANLYAIHSSLQSMMQLNVYIRWRRQTYTLEQNHWSKGIAEEVALSDLEYYATAESRLACRTNSPRH